MSWRLLWSSILLFSFFELGVMPISNVHKNSKSLLMNTTTPYKHIRRMARTYKRIKDPRDSRISRPTVKVDMNDLATLLPLASDMSKFIATYNGSLSRSTQPLPFRFYHWRKHSTKDATVSRTVRSNYVTKRRYAPCRIKKSQRRAMIYNYLVETLSQFNEEKKQQLTVVADKQPVIHQYLCYWTVFSTFMRRCHYTYFFDGGMTKMKALLARACEADWLSTQRIVSILSRSCQSRFKYLYHEIEECT